MQNFDATTFNRVIDLLGQIKGECDCDNRYGHPKRVITKKKREIYLNLFQAFEKGCLNSNLITSVDTTRKIIRLLSSNDPIIVTLKLNELGQELMGRLTVEMQSIKFFYIEPAKQDFILNDDLFGEQIAKAFPSAEQDIKHAGICFAFEEWTASVFHSMRVLEIGLSVLAKELGVPYEHRNWENIINDIEVEIKKISKTTHGDEWKTKEQFYSEVALQFRYFKNAWRNHVMHVRDTYDEQRAITIFEHVKEFMTHLTTNPKLKEE